MPRHICPYSRKMKRYCKVLLILFSALVALFYIQRTLYATSYSGVPITNEERSIPPLKNDYKKDSSYLQHPNVIASNILNEEINTHVSSKSIVNKLKPKLRKFVTPIDQLIGNNESLWSDQLGAAKNEKEQKFKEEGYNTYAFNTLVSLRLGLSRTLPDTRHKECRKLEYSNELPSASVIICYYHEELNVLLRTIHSVIERTPSNILKEILVINDQSDIDISSNITSHLGILVLRALQSTIHIRLI